MGQNYQSHLALLLPQQHLSKTCLHLYLCCCFWMFDSQTSRPFLCHPACVHQEDCRLSLTSHLASQDVLANAQLTFTHKSTYLSRRAHKCTIDFHSQVIHLSRHARKCTVDFHSQVSQLSRCACRCTIDFHSQVSQLSRCERNILRFSYVNALLTTSSHLPGPLLPVISSEAIFHVCHKASRA